MVNKIGNKRYNKLLSYRNNYYNIGGSLNKLYNTLSGNPDKNGNITTGAFKGMSTEAANMIGAASSALGSAAGNLIGGGYSSKAGNILGGLSTVAGAIPGPWGILGNVAAYMTRGMANLLSGAKWNEENINKTESTISNLRGLQADANSTDTLANMANNLALGNANFSNSYIGDDGWFSNKVAKKAKRLRAEMRDANDYAIDTLELNADNINTGILDSLESNYAALGGFINKYSDGGSIHINPANRGKFNATKKRTGKTTEELTHSKNPLTRKRAIFAQNASHWKHAFGGHLNTNGSDFMTGLTYIDNGDTHENNPYEGVPMGADSEGTPNLVEQGEVVFNDYVYSNRLQVPKDVKKKYKLRDNMTFADAVKYLTKSYEERPNDSISRDTAMEILADLANAQEAERANESIRINKNKSAYGGRINKFKTGGDTKETDFNWNNLGETPLWNNLLEQPNPSSPTIFNNTWMPTAINPYKGVPNYYGYDKPSWMNDKGEYNKEYTDFINNVYNVDMFKKHLKDQFNFYDNATEEQKKSPRYAAIQNFIDTSPEWYENRNTIDDWAISDNLFNTAKKLAVDKNTGIMHVGDMFAQYKRGKANSLMPNGLFPNNLNDRIKTPDLIKNAGKEEPPLYLGRSNEALRYAPAIGLGAAVISDALGLTNNPEYENAARIEDASRADYKPVGFERLGNYLKYRPFDTDYLLNRMDADAAASRRAIANQSAGNTGAAIAGILASDYNTIGRLGEAKIAADKENFARRAQVEEFNRATNQYNSQGALQADTANQGAYANALGRRLTGLTTAAQMRQGIKDAAEANRAANISEFLSALGDMGYENKSMNIIRRLAESGALGGLSAGHPLAEEIATPGSRRKNKRRR